jgi:hypothetical protein
VALDHLKISVEQEVEFHADGGHKFRETYTLISKDEGAVAARNPDKVEKTLTLNLADIKYHVAKEKKKKGHNKAVSAED